MHDSMFSDAAAAAKSLELVSFQAFADTADAVSAITACQEGKVGSSLQHFLTKKLKKLLKKSSDNGLLAVADKALAVSLKQDDVLTDAVKIVHDDKTAELFRGIRCYMEELLGGPESNITATDLRKMQLGLSHSLGRYKLKFSADKVDTMVIQAVGLLDELDKEINTYAMRVKVIFLRVVSKSHSKSTPSHPACVFSLCA
jgi:nucleolar protein 58